MHLARMQPKGGPGLDPTDGLIAADDTSAFLPRYFFHRTDGYVENDTDGIELRGLVEARLHAVVFAGETLKDDPERVWRGQEMRVEVTDPDGVLLFTVVTECINAPSLERRLKV